MLAPVTLRAFPPIGYSSLPGVENMPWVRDNGGLILVGTLHYEIRQIRQLIEEQE
jgi:hypothetical protein